MRGAAVAAVLMTALLAAGGARRARHVGPHASAALLDRFDLRRSAAAQVSLPPQLREISGLAVTPDGRLLAHGDEQGIVYELDPRRGAIVKAFSLGTPPIRGDFEGIATAGTRVFLMTSDGYVYETREGRDGATVPYTRYDTGLGATCELEGLAFEPSDRSLIIPCKRPRDHALRRAVTLFRWSVDRHASAAPARVTIPLDDAVRGTGEGEFHPSSVERDAASGHYVIVAGPQRALIEVTPSGRVVATRALPRHLHRQPEGVTLLGDSVLLVADEASGKRATLTRYYRAR